MPIQYRPQSSGEGLGLAEVAQVLPGQVDDRGLEVNGEPLRCLVSPMAGRRAVAVAGARCDRAGHPYCCELAGCGIVGEVGSQLEDTPCRDGDRDLPAG